jgi:3-dehydroquinate dehydratase-2
MMFEVNSKKMARPRILLVNGPNLNLLGRREPEIYGHDTLQDVVDKMRAFADSLGAELEDFQSNYEGELISRVHEAMGNIDFIVINAGAFTHTSVALRDALLGVSMPYYEIHISNVYAREEFRHHSFISDKAQGVACGIGQHGYELCIKAGIRSLELANTSQQEPAAKKARLEKDVVDSVTPAGEQVNILILNGPNHILQGTREKDIYGDTTLQQAIDLARQTVSSLGNANLHELTSNSEGDLITRIHESMGNIDAIVVNPGLARLSLSDECTQSVLCVI